MALLQRQPMFSFLHEKTDAISLHSVEVFTFETSSENTNYLSNH